MIWVAKKYLPHPVERALSISSGDGCLERHALHLNVARIFDAIDISPQVVELAKTKARELGYAERVHYVVADLNPCRLKPRGYDTVFASMSLHHVRELEHILTEIRNSSKPGGLFVIHEYVGPNQFQWTDVQLKYANELLAKIPERFRRSPYTGRLKTQVTRQTREQMTAGDITESIRSSDILPLVERMFEIVERKDFGGTLLHPVLEEIAGNFRFESDDMAVMRTLIESERQLLRDGRLTSDFTLIVARSRARNGRELSGRPGSVSQT